MRTKLCRNCGATIGVSDADQEFHCKSCGADMLLLRCSKCRRESTVDRTWLGWKCAQCQSNNPNPGYRRSAATAKRIAEARSKGAEAAAHRSRKEWVAIVVIVVGVLVVIVALASDGDDVGTSAAIAPPAVVTSPALGAPPTCSRNNIDCLNELGHYLAAADGFAGTESEDAFVVSYQVCSTAEPREFVEQDFETGGSVDPVDVAQAYATEMFQPGYEQASFEGCLHGFNDDP